MTVDTCGNLFFPIFLLRLLILKDLKGWDFMDPHAVLPGRTLFSAIYEYKKGDEKFLPTCVHCHVAKSTLCHKYMAKLVDVADDWLAAPLR